MCKDELCLEVIQPYPQCFGKIQDGGEHRRPWDMLQNGPQIVEYFVM